MSRMVFKNKRDRQSTTLNVTSLIDVLFLLLIFFMIAGTFEKVGALDLTLPQSETAEPQGASDDPTLIRLAIKRDGSTYFNDAPIAEDEISSRLTEARRGGSQRVLIEAEEDVPHGSVVRLLDFVRDAGFSGVAIGAETGQTSRPGSN